MRFFFSADVALRNCVNMRNAGRIINISGMCIFKENAAEKMYPQQGHP